MRCEDVQAQLADHLAGTLPPDEEQQLMAHVRGCPACADEVEGLSETWAMLGAVKADRPDPAVMRARFTAALHGYEQGRHMLPARRQRVTWYGMQAAAAAALLVLGVALGRQSAASPPPDPQIAGLREELRDMRQMVTLSLLQQQSASERLKGVTWSGQIEQPGDAITTALLDTLMHDPNVNVRLASIDALKRFGERDAVRRGALEALMQQTSPLVQMALIDFVVEVNGREAVETLRRLSNDPMLNDDVRARAAQGAQQVG